jgi:hypothetical protein
MNVIITATLLLSMIAVDSPAAVLKDGSRSLQEATAIHGTVKDPYGAVIAGALVRINRISESGDSSGTATESGRQRPIATNTSGQFSVKLPAGTYQVCVTAREGFDSECRGIRVEVGQDVNAEFSLTIDPVWLKAHGRADSEVMDQRLRTLAWTNAVACGHVRVKGNPANATKCVMQAFRHRQPFIVRYDLAGIDSDIAGGLAGDGSGNVYGVEFDGIGMTVELKDGETMPDGSHTIVMPCPKPVKIRANKRGRATCFRKEIGSRLRFLDEE